MDNECISSFRKNHSAEIFDHCYQQAFQLIECFPGEIRIAGPQLPSMGDVHAYVYTAPLRVLSLVKGLHHVPFLSSESG